MNKSPFELREFLDRDIAADNPAMASEDFTRLGVALARAVKFHQDEGGDWNGQIPILPGTRFEGVELQFQLHVPRGVAAVSEVDPQTDFILRAAYLPLDNSMDAHFQPHSHRIVTNSKKGMDVVAIPVDADIDSKRLARAYKTTRHLTRSVLNYYSVHI